MWASRRLKLLEITAPMRHRLHRGPLLAELREALLAADQLGQDEAEGGEHGKASVVEFLVAHVLVVHAQAHRVAKVARLLGRVLRPDDRLQQTGNEKKRGEAVGARGRGHGAKASGHVFKSGELDG